MKAGAMLEAAHLQELRAALHPLISLNRRDGLRSGPFVTPHLQASISGLP